jgi:hypothetical protein
MVIWVLLQMAQSIGTARHTCMADHTWQHFLTKLLRLLDGKYAQIQEII